MKTEKSAKWWQDSVIYHIYPFSFYDSNNDGIGDIEGIIQKLDYLNDGTPNSLGIDAIWVTPIFPSPWADYGYDVSNYIKIDPLFGDIAAAERLIEECHKRGIKVIFDFVPNHTSNENPWFLESKSSLNNPKHDFYIWADPSPDGGVPSLHQSVFKGSAWEFAHRRGQYYFHYFYKEQPDLNWRNPLVRKMMNNALSFWLNKGIDGFRFDAVKHLFEKFLHADQSSFPVRTLTRDEAHEIFREWRKILDAYGAVAISEAWDTDINAWKSYYGKNLDGFHLPLNFFLMNTQWTAPHIRWIIDTVQANLPAGAWANWSAGNHDIGRFVNRYGAEQARICAMLLLTLRGTPILYYGDEIGMSDVYIPPGKIRDRFGRDRARTPMQWTNERNANFTQGAPWLPIGDTSKANVALQSNDPTSLLALYKKLIWLRKGSKTLRHGTYESINTESGECLAYLRSLETEKLLVVLNFSGNEQKPGNCRESRSGRILFSTHLDREGAVTLQDFSIRPHEGCIIQLD